MTANIITIKWSDLHIPNSLYHLLIDLKYFDVVNSYIDEKAQQTTLEGSNIYSKYTMSKSIDLIPNQILINTDKSIRFYATKIFNLKDFQNILSFIKSHCSYIYEFVQDQNIESLHLYIKRNISSGVLPGIEASINEFSSMKSWLEDTNNNNITPILLSALIHKFYQPDAKTFEVPTSSKVSRILKYTDHINTLLDSNIDILKKYSIKSNLDACMPHDQLFSFLDHKILSTKYFPIYQQNLDIKFLSYISCIDLKEKAVNAENLTSIL